MCVQEHCWPPLSYEKAMEEHRKKYLDAGRRVWRREREDYRVERV